MTDAATSEIAHRAAEPPIHRLFIAGDIRGYRDVSWLAALGEGRVFCTRANYLVRYYYR
jgi:hypothetical protein